MKHLSMVAVVLFLCGAANAELRTQPVEYRSGSAVLEGFLAYDEGLAGKRPGIIVVHEWWGLNDFIKERSEQLAKLGYIAFAIDIYGKGIRAKSAEQAAALSKRYSTDRRLLRERAAAGLNWLRGHPLADPGRIAAIGFCFGGLTVLEMARNGDPLKGVVSFHGILNTPNPEDAARIKGSVLVFQGVEDPFAPAKERLAFEDEMEKGKVDWQMVIFGGAVHGFTNPANGKDRTKGVAYDLKADRRSWEGMRLFLNEVLSR